MNKIQKYGLQLKWLVQVLLISSPVIYLTFIGQYGPAILLHLPAGIFLQLDSAGILTKFITNFIPALTPLCYWFALFHIFKLAQQYAAGNVFTNESVQRIKWIGIFLFLSDFIYMFQIAITGPLLSWLGVTENFLIIELKLGVSIIGLFLILISRIMQLALQLDEQQKLTI